MGTLMQNRIEGSNSRTWLSWLTVMPLTAILHNLVFYHPTCLLNPFGPESVSAYQAWFFRDPSLGWAVVAATLMWAFAPRSAVIWFLIAFAPLTLWIWDIPGSGRTICRHFHDGRLILPILGHIRSRDFYMLGALVMLAHPIWHPLPLHLGSRLKIDSTAEEGP
jgi:hypothetical protein